jgi:SAM-dependent methyltransferase
MARVTAPAESESRTHYWEWTSADEQPHHRYLLPAILRALGPPGGRSLLDVGCGNGALTARLASAGFRAAGMDFEVSGIERARDAHPELEFAVQDVSRPLPDTLRDRFDVVVAAEVIEHLFLPRQLFARAREALTPDGTFVVTTPYHGYLKNLMIAAFNQFDEHVGSLADYCHIKFFSRKTLGTMARQCGFDVVRWDSAGRVPPVAASMVLSARLNGSDQSDQSHQSRRGQPAVRAGGLLTRDPMTR